jgi:hypothetical protein
VKCYISIISMRLWITLCVLIYTNKHFWRHCYGNGCWVNFEPSLTLYRYSFIFYLLFFSFYHGSSIHSYLTIRCTYKRTLRATRILKAYPDTWLWAMPVLTNMVRDQSFLGEDDENPYSHLNEFELTCACLCIVGMSDETLWWKFFLSPWWKRANIGTSSP